MEPSKGSKLPGQKPSSALAQPCVEWRGSWSLGALLSHGNDRMTSQNDLASCFMLGRRNLQRYIDIQIYNDMHVIIYNSRLITDTGHFFSPYYCTLVQYLNSEERWRICVLNFVGDVAVPCFGVAASQVLGTISISYPSKIYCSLRLCIYI